MTSMVGQFVGEKGTTIITSTTSVYHNADSEMYTVEVYHRSLSGSSGEFTDVQADKTVRAEEVVSSAVQKLGLGNPQDFELIEVFSSGGQICKERRLFGSDNPVKIQLLWPRLSSASLSEAHQPGYNFMLRRKELQQKPGVWIDTTELNLFEGFLTRFLQQPRNREYQDLCNLPDLNETTLLENLKKRFNSGMIYTYVGSILISINPFRFFPIYNPKYVRMYQNRRLSDLPPHIFAIADSAYHTMMKTRINQCIVISGESGSGKTESTNLLLHHLSALSQRGFYSDGIEQSILGVGPVLEAFGNAKTVHNNNSSRFGKFVQVNYRANGSVHGASVEKYLLEKSRIVSQASNERNYHVFYYLLAGASPAEVDSLCLGTPREYFYLNQNDCYRLEGLESDSEAQEFARLRHAMDIVGFSTDNQQRIFAILSAVLHIGNIEFRKKSEHGYHDEAVSIKNMKEILLVSKLLKVKELTLTEALTKRKTMAGGEIVVMSYKMAEAISTRDAMAKCLYSALFDWIVFQINAALVCKHDSREHEGNSIGVLDIFGFEDFQSNSFEQFCINYANESLHYYFNQHIFKFEQEEYMREGIQWKNIEFIDNTECLDLFCKKPTGLLPLLDEECSFPGATNETLLNKFNNQHQTNSHFEVPQTRQSAFSIIHYAGKVKYNIQDFREKNSDLMRHDILVLLKNSNMAFLRELIGQDPLAVLRWALVRVFFRACFAFIDSGRKHRKCGSNVARFGGILRPEQPQKRIPLLSDSRTSLFGDRNKSKSDRRLGHSPSLEFTCTSNPLSPFLPGGRLFRKKTSRRLSCPGEHDVIAEASKNYDIATSDQSPLHEESNAPQKQQKSSVITKNKVYRPRFRAVRQLRDMDTHKTMMSGKLPVGIRTSKSKTKPRSISAQFHNSLQRLMDTLNQANPFFIRCIKSNAEKAPCVFDEELVQRQLKYTGMLATVKIRQSGYNYRLSFEDFIYQYHLLLPKGRRSSRNDIVDFLHMLDLNQENYQIGATKVFLRETEKLLLEDALHQALLVRIKCIQHWMRGRLQRLKYLQIKSSTVTLQTCMRGAIARRKAVDLRHIRSACVVIQSIFLGFRDRRRYQQQLKAIVDIQRVVRGFFTRKRLAAERNHLHLIPGEHESQVPEGGSCDHQRSELSPKNKDGILNEDYKRDVVSGAINASIYGNNRSESVFCSEEILGNLNKTLNSDVIESCLVTTHSDLVSIVDSREGVNPVKSEAVLLSQTSVTLDSTLLEQNIGVVEAGLNSYASNKQLVFVSSHVLSSGIVSSVNEKPAGSEASSLSHKPPLEQSLVDNQLQTEVDDSAVDICQAEGLLLSVDRSQTIVSDIARVSKDYESKYLVRSNAFLPVLTSVPCSLESSVLSGSCSLNEVVLELKHGTPKKKNCSEQRFHDDHQLGGLSDVAVKKTPSRSAPQSPTKFQGSTPFEKEMKKLDEGDLKPHLRITRDSSPSVRRIEKSQSAIIPNLRTQAGPRDVEIEVKPIIMKASSEEILSVTCQTIPRSVMCEKRLQAPLARMESITDERHAEDESGVETVRMIIEDDPKRAMPFQRSFDENQSGHALSRSPFRRGNKKTKRPLNTGSKDGGLSSAVNVGYDNSSRKVKNSASRPKLKHQHLGPTMEPTQLTNTVQGVLSSSSNAVPSSWSVSSTTQWTYPLDRVVRNIHELKQLEQFFTTKTAWFSKSAGSKDSSVYDVVFKDALNEFHSNLITQVSTAMQENIAYKYKDLMCSFEEVLSAKARQLCKADDGFPLTLFINAFRGFVDEFIKKRDNKELPDVKIKKDSVKRKKKKETIVVEYLGHKFLQIQFTIPTFCEICSSVIWVLEKGYVCKVCKFTVHRKCYEKSQVPCTGSTSQAAIAAQVGSKIIGAPLSVLVKDGHLVPVVIERLIGVIEMNGLYTVGVYRKPGNAAQIKQLIKDINDDASQIDFSEHHIHILTSVLKAFFREMPEPLMTFELYDDFIRVADVNDKERIKSLYGVFKKLPQANYSLLERLIFHLARVALQEGSNLMSSNSLAIIFAPSILRTNSQLPTQESLNHVPKQTLCVQCIIESQLKKIKDTLNDIRVLDNAAVTANEKLATLRASKRQTKLTLVEISESHQQLEIQDDDPDERTLSAKIQSLQDEKETLTHQLTALECRVSNSEDDLLSADEVESTADELDDCDTESQISTSDNGYLQKVARNLTRRRNKPPPQKTDKYRFINLAEVPDSPFELKPARSNPELHELDEDDLFD